MSPTITINVDGYLRDCPPWDTPISDDLLPEVAEEVARRFDSTSIYGQIDELACLLLRERGAAPASCLTEDGGNS